MMNAQGYLICNLICYTHYRCRSARETRHSLHISGEMGNRYLSLGKDRIAGRKQMDMHFMPPFLWANSSITPPPQAHTLVFYHLKAMSTRDAWKPSWALMWYSCVSLNWWYLPERSWKSFRKGKGTCAQRRRRRIKAQGRKGNSSQGHGVHMIASLKDQNATAELCVHACISVHVDHRMVIAAGWGLWAYRGLSFCSWLF